MYCKKCGNEIVQGEKFCRSCGCRIELNTSYHRKTENKQSTQSFVPIVIFIVAFVSVAIVILVIVTNSKNSDIIDDTNTTISNVSSSEYNNSLNAYPNSLFNNSYPVSSYNNVSSSYNYSSNNSSSSRYISSSTNSSMNAQTLNKKGYFTISDGRLCSFTTSYVCNNGEKEVLYKDLKNGCRIVAEKKYNSYGITWYECRDANNNDYYGWVDSKYISFTN